MKMCAKRKAGRRERARRLYPSHGPLRFITSHSCFTLASTMRKTKRLRRRLPRHDVRCLWTTASLCRYCGSYWTGQFFLSARKPIRYSVNIALQSFLYGSTPIRLYKGLVKKYGGGGWAGAERGWVMRFWALCKGWVVQFWATLRGWVTLFYYIDGH